MIHFRINSPGRVNRGRALYLLYLLASIHGSLGLAQNAPNNVTTEIRPSVWFDDFVVGVECFINNPNANEDAACSQENPQSSLKDFDSADKKTRTDLHKISSVDWKLAFERHGVDRDFLRNRIHKASSQQNLAQDKKAFRRGQTNYRSLLIETPIVDKFSKNNHLDAQSALTDQQNPQEGRLKLALHATKLTVHEDYDDVTNDNVYMYFITTADDVVWGKATSTYKGLDEHTAVFLNAEDRGVFSPTGEKATLPQNHLIVDFGLIESDDEDIDQLKKISDAIIDLALVATSIASPEAGAAASQARAEVKNLLRFIVELETDDRLVTDSLYLTPSNIESTLKEQSYHEIERVYEAETFWTHFKYGMMFRLLR